MITNRTFTMIKPCAFEKGYAGGILSMILEAGFRIVALKLIKLTPDQAREFYVVHKGKPFYEGLVEFMASGPIIAAILEKENAVKDYRAFIGNTNPDLAEEGTIRKKFATSMSKNGVHGSDSDENAAFEGSFFFSLLEIIN